MTMNKNVIRISINGTVYPARPTMGAMLRFKRETGKEVSQMAPDSISEIAIWMWCCAKSACNADKVDFPYSMEDFADAVDMETLSEFNSQTSAGLESGDEKKSL